MKRKYVARKGEYKDQWYVCEAWGEDRGPEDRAIFFGKGCSGYAREHANKLNALPPEDQP